MATRGQQKRSCKHADSHFTHYAVCFIHEDVSLALCLSSDSVAAAVDVEHEVFRSSKSSNLYKAAILRKVTADLSAFLSRQMKVDGFTDVSF